MATKRDRSVRTHTLTLVSLRCALTVTVAAILSLAGCGTSGGENGFQSPGEQREQAPPPAGRIVFWSDGGNGPCVGIYSLWPDGSNLRRLTRTPLFAFQPTWSPDGRRIAFVAGCGGGGRFDLCVMDADGANIRTIVKDVEIDAPTWSPDGRQLAFTRARDGRAKADVHVVGTDGTNERILIEDAQRAAWSPDGTRLAVVSGRDGTDKIYLVNPDGTGLLRVTDGPKDQYPHGPRTAGGSRSRAHVHKSPNLSLTPSAVTRPCSTYRSHRGPPLTSMSCEPTARLRSG